MQELKQALALIDVRALDHFIVAGSGVLSFAERGVVVADCASVNHGTSAAAGAG